MSLRHVGNFGQIVFKVPISFNSFFCKTKRITTIPSCGHISTIRALHLFSRNNRKLKNNDCENSSLTDTVDNTVEGLRNVLNCSVEEALDLYTKNHDFLSNSNSISHNVSILKQNGIALSTMKDNFWILKYNTGQLESRIKLLNKWLFTNPNNGISMLKLSFQQLMKYTSRLSKEMSFLNGNNRITYFAFFVQCEEKQACDQFVKYSFMLSLKLNSIKEILFMLRDQGVMKEDLLNDLWLFRYSPQFISDRIELLERIGAREKCKVIKPWMLRCSEPILNRYLELRDENIAALGSYSNLRELLSSELALSSDDVQEMIMKHPPVARISYSKAKDMIDFLKAEGFDSKMICHVPRVLCHKQATLMARMVELKKINPYLINLQNLCRNKKDYIAFVNKMS